MALENLVIVNWPEKPKEDYRVVQIELYNVNYLVFPYEGYGNMHCFVMRDFLKDKNIEHQNIPKRNGSIPALEGERYKVHGMGLLDIDVEKKFAGFYGSSGDYEIYLNLEMLEAVHSIKPDWTIEMDKRSSSFKLRERDRKQYELNKQFEESKPKPKKGIIARFLGR